jgi:flagellar hook-length control protein FliK
MTMSMVSTGIAPTATNQGPRAQTDGDATGSGAAEDGGFAGLVAALVAGAEPVATATAGEAVPGTVDPDADTDPAAAAAQLALEALVVPAVATTVTAATGPTGTPSTAASTPGPALVTSAPVPADATADPGAQAGTTDPNGSPAAGSGLPAGESGGEGGKPADGRAPAAQLSGTPVATGAVVAAGADASATRGLGQLGAAVAQITDAGATPTTEPAAVTGLGATAPVTTAATPAVAPVAALPPPATAAQLVPAVFAVHRRGVEGEHHMTLDITPEELGPVRMTVALRDGQVHMLLAGSSELSREALRAALPELRKLIEATGIVAGSFDVQPDNAGTGRGGADLGRSAAETGHGDGAPNSGDRDGSSGTAPAKDAAPAPAHSGSSRSLDLHL